jgi:hypothetical protein
MKKIIMIAVAIATASYCFAQNDSLRIKLDNIFQHLDKSVVPTGMLKEYGYEFANLESFNGLLTDSNIISNNTLRLAYASLLSSTIYGNASLPLMEAFNAKQKSKLGDNINPVNVLLINYASLKPNAVDDGILSIANEQLYNGNGVSPYLTQTLFAAAPVYSESRDGKVNLLFSTDLFYTNNVSTINTIEVDFNNGNGFVNATPDIPVHAQYTDTGNKRITIKISFANGATMQCYNQMRITHVAATFANRYAPQEVPSIQIPASTQHSGGQIFVQYSVNNSTPTNNRKLVKPFIVVEGFDMHDAAPGIQKLGYTYNTFRDDISDFSTTFSNASFNDNLDNVAGYDLIFLNYNDGTDDILRNAKLLEEVINWVNNNKVPGADANVVMGISMGGLVSRYCLASMTKRSLNPQTRLLITHDSPHRGANIPLAYQHAIFGLQNFVIKVGPLEMRLGSIISQLDEFEVLRNRPATQQQILALANHGGSVTMNTF